MDIEPPASLFGYLITAIDDDGNTDGHDDNGGDGDDNSGSDDSGGYDDCGYGIDDSGGYDGGYGVDGYDNGGDGDGNSGYDDDGYNGGENSCKLLWKGESPNEQNEFNRQLLKSRDLFIVSFLV